MSASSPASSAKVVIVYVTCPDTDCAQAIASELVARRAAACVSSVPGMQSTYRWQGRIETATETLLMIKTRSGRLDAIRSCVTELHPDELPELIAVEVSDGSAAYLDWVRTETDSPTNPVN